MYNHKCKNIFDFIKNSSHTHCDCFINYYISQKNDRIDGGKTPLMISCIFNNFYSVNQLITNGANINHMDNQGLTALHYAAIYGRSGANEKLKRSGIIGFLFDIGKADPNVKDIFGNTPLHFSYYNKNLNTIPENYIKVIKCLLKNGSDINSKNKWGQTPLDVILLHKDMSDNDKLMNILIEYRERLKQD
jgi:ankyrin repeat protein